MIIYSLTYHDGDGERTDWCRNKAQAEKRKRELTGVESLYQDNTYNDDINYIHAPDIVKHVIAPNKDGVIWFLNNYANRNQG